MTYHFSNYVFEGGGVKGLAYVGALKALDEKGIHKQITRVAGASAGAICALLVALNYTTDEIQDILWALDFKNFMDGDWGIIKDTKRLIEDYGWYKGDFFQKWIKTTIEKKTGSQDTSFRDLHDHGDFKALVLVGTNLSTHYSEVFSYEKTPDMKVHEALRITMSIPLFFKAVKREKEIYVDGGLLMNYPIKAFDRLSFVKKDNLQRKHHKAYYKPINSQLKDKDKNFDKYVYNKETLGFKLDTKEDIGVFADGHKPTDHKIHDLFDYMWNLVETVYRAQQNLHLHSDDWHRTVYIDTLGVKTTDFKITEALKKALVQSGYDHTMKYFQWFDDPKKRVQNR